MDIEKRRRPVLALALALALILGILCRTGPVRAGGDTLVYAVDGQFASMDVYASVQINLLNLFFQLNDPLLDRDPVSGEIIPGLVSGWRRMDPLTWEFTLRPGVLFHNGVELTAEAVRFTLMDFILNPEKKSPLAGGFNWVREVRITGRYVFRILTRKPYPLVLDRLTYLFPYEPGYAASAGPDGLALRPVGTGPYKFQKWQRGSKLVLTANPDYWRPGLPRIKRLIYRVIPEVSTRMSELLAGGVDLAANIDPDMVDKLETTPGLKILAGPTYRLNFWQFDGSGRAGKTPLTDVRVRRAVWHAVDRETIVRTVLKGMGRVVNSPAIPGHGGFDPGVKGYPYDPDRARTLLREAGYGGGLGLEVWYNYGFQNRFNQAAAGYLEKVGIKLKFRDLRGNVGQLVKLRNSGRIGGIGNFTWGSIFVHDADAVLPAWFLTGEPKCYNPDPELDRWLTEARYTLDRPRRNRLYSRAQKRIVERAYWMPLFQAYSIYGLRENLDLEFRPDTMLRLETARWK